MPPPAPTLPLDDLQGWLVRGYHMPFGLHAVLAFADAAAARRCLAPLAARVTSAAPWPGGFKPAVTVNVALTFDGLRLLGVPDADLGRFPDEFREGMAARAAAAPRFGDVGPSAPDAWEVGRPGQPAHALVSVHAVTGDGRDQELAALRAGYDPGVTEVFAQPTALLPGEVEHFGFRDGLSQPTYEGVGLAVTPGNGEPAAGGGWRALKTGEFVHGYPDETGAVAGPTTPLARNGTFLVLRKLRQHVGVFRRYLSDTAARLYGSAAPANVERVAAKMVGRWRSGAPLVAAPDADDPALAADDARNNDFRYAADPVGTACPRGSHVRRTNPRDSLLGRDVAVNLHRMLRRGMPYGDWLPDGAADDDPGRGLVFIALVGDIDRQFEFVQRQWVNDGAFADLGGGDRDPVIGAADLPGTGSFLIPGASPPFLFGLPRFTATRGGGYFFVPGVAALRRLTSA